MAAPKQLNRLTVAEAVASYTEALEARLSGGDISAATLDGYLIDLTEFVILAGPSRVLDDLEGPDLDKVFRRYAVMPDRRYKHTDKKRGPSAQARFAKVVSALFSFAEQERYIQLNPMPDCKAKPKAPKGAAANRAGLEEAAAGELLDAVTSRRDKFLIRLMLEVGPRVSEISNANRDSLQKRRGVWWLSVVGKGGKPRDLPLSEATMKAWKLYEQSRTDSNEALLVTHRGARLMPRDMQRIVKKLSGNKATPHALRHTAATTHLNNGANVRNVQALLGHENLATTGIYLEAFPAEIAAMVNNGPLAK